MTCNVFTYGSLMFPEVWTLVVAGDYASTPATLAAHARYGVVDQDYPGMIPLCGGRVAGTLYLDVDAVDVARLDHFEGDDYRRETVTVDDPGGFARRAETYIYLRQDRLLASAWDPDAFAMDHFIATYCRQKLEPPLEP